MNVMRCCHMLRCLSTFKSSHVALRSRRLELLRGNWVGDTCFPALCLAVENQTLRHLLPGKWWSQEGAPQNLKPPNIWANKWETKAKNTKYTVVQPLVTMMASVTSHRKCFLQQSSQRLAFVVSMQSPRPIWSKWCWNEGCYAAGNKDRKQRFS